MPKVNIDDLKTRLDPISVVLKYGQQEPDKMIHCPSQTHPQTGKTPPCQMDYRTGLWNCFGCGAGGDILDFIGYALFADYDADTRPHFKELIDLLAGAQIAPMPTGEKYLRLRTEQPAAQLKLDRTVLLDWTDNLLAEPALLEYLAKRGIDKNVVRYQLGYTAKDPRLTPGNWHKIVIPYLYRGVFVAAKLRHDPCLPLKENQPKYISLTGSSFSMPFNMDCLNRHQDMVYVVESELDALALMELTDSSAVIARNAGGFKLQDAQWLINARKVFVVLDNDEAGRKQGRAIKTLVHRAKLIAPPADYKDLGQWLQDTLCEYPRWISEVSK